jgi:hypothetical protein
MLDNEGEDEGTVRGLVPLLANDFQLTICQLDGYLALFLPLARRKTARMPLEEAIDPQTPQLSVSAVVAGLFGCLDCERIAPYGGAVH